jgi:hypothetical protein
LGNDLLLLEDYLVIFKIVGLKLSLLQVMLRRAREDLRVEEFLEFFPVLDFHSYF